MEHNRVLKLPISAKDDIDMTLPKPVPDSTFAWDSEGKKLIPCINPTVAMERAENAAKQTEEDRQAVSVMKSGVDSVLSDATTKAQQLRDTIENGKRELSEYVENAKLQTQAQTESVNSKLNEYNQKAEETSGALENKTQKLNSIVSNATESINNSKRQIESSVNEAKESVNAIKSSLDNYYTKPQIDNKLSGLGGGGGVTANEVDEKINAAGEALLQLVETHIPKKLSQLELDPINQLNVKSIINLTTPEESDNSNKVATTEFVTRAISKIPNGGAIPPETLNTIQENKTGLSALKGKVSAVETNLSNKQDKGNYAHLVNGKVPKTELPKLETWLNEEDIKTGSMEVWKYD